MLPSVQINHFVNAMFDSGSAPLANSVVLLKPLCCFNPEREFDQKTFPSGYFSSVF